MPRQLWKGIVCWTFVSDTFYENWYNFVTHIIFTLPYLQDFSATVPRQHFKYWMICLLETYVHMFAAWQSLVIVRLPLKSLPVSNYAWWRHQMEIFPRHWPFVWGIHRSPVNSPQNGQSRGALMFSFICAWINGWVNNRAAGDLKRHDAHYDVIVMDLTSYNNYPGWTKVRHSYDCKNSTLYFKISLSLWWGPRVLCNGEDIKYSSTQSNKKSTYCTA